MRLPESQNVGVSQEEVARAVLGHAAARFHSCLLRYKPWHGSNNITESNTVSQIAASFLELVPGGMAFMEVPFKGEGKSWTGNHLDAYLCGPSLAFLVEAKMVYSSRHIRDMRDDMRRMTPDVLAQIHARHVTPPLPPEYTCGLVVAETWTRTVPPWWKGDSTTGLSWDRTLLPRDWTYDYLPVVDTGSGPEDELFWLYAVGPGLSLA